MEDIAYVLVAVAGANIGDERRREWLRRRSALGTYGSTATIIRAIRLSL